MKADMRLVYRINISDASVTQINSVDLFQIARSPSSSFDAAGLVFSVGFVILRRPDPKDQGIVSSKGNQRNSQDFSGLTDVVDIQWTETSV